MLRSSLAALACLALGSGAMACSDSGDDRNGAPTGPDLPLAPTRPRAPAAGSECDIDAEGLQTIERPMFPGRADSPTFGYSFKVHAGADPSGPAVIFLTGGPGSAGIVPADERIVLPESFTLIETDLRGVGCNAPPRSDYYPDEFYGTVAFADDVLAIVQELGLEAYLLYGVSYGTELATITASRAEAQGITPPRALVLEGVLGRAFVDGDEVQAGFLEEWSATRARLPEAVRARLAVAPLPLALSPAQWGDGIAYMLSVGAIPETGTPLADELLSALDPDASERARQNLRDNVLRFSSAGLDDFGERVFDEVACRELSEDNALGFELRAGELMPARPVCGDHEMDAPFAAEDWPVTSPIYYYAGTDDPNTPPWQAEVHFAAQTGAPRHLARIRSGGHSPFQIDLQDCMPALWAAMATDGDMVAALDDCMWPIELTVEPARPRAG